MATRVLTCTLVLLLAPLFAGCFSGTDSFGSPDDAVHAQERSRANRGQLSPTELPPGLGPDLAPPMTQPAPSK